MNKFFILLMYLSTTALQADITKKLYNLYQSGAYEESCAIGRNFFTKMQHDENFVSIYAFSCLKSDQIDRLNGPIMALSQTQESRANSSYFAMLVMQKKLLMQALYDNKEFNALNFPSSSHLLSKIFRFYCKDPQRETSIKTYVDPSNTRIIYKLYATESNERKTLAIDEFYDNILTMHHVYN